MQRISSVSQRFSTLGVIAAAAVAVLQSGAFADSASWTTATSGNWSTGPWSASPAFPNAASDIATFSQDWTGQTINVDTPITVGQILATDTTANGGLIISGGTLTLGSSPIISTGTNNAFGESAANRFKISSVLDGANGFERQGNGYLDLSGVTNIFTGTVKLTAAASGGGSFTVINSDANLGNAANTLSVALSGQPVGFYNDAAAGNFTLNSARTITTSGTGAFWVKNKIGANMSIAGVISGTAQLRKNDSGTLTLTGANSFTGGTLLDGGTLVLSGGDNRLASDRAITFNSVSTLDLTNTSQTVTGLGLLAVGQTNTISGSSGTLILAGTGDYTVNTTVTGTSLNMSGLSNFTFNRPANSLQLNANGANVVNTINLAKAGTNTISATNVRFGGGANAAGQNVLIGLGQSNDINAANEFVIGFFQGNGNVSFQSGLTNPTLTIRGAGGGSTPVPLMTIGSTNSGNQPSTGILNLTGGNINLIATNLNVARHFANANTNSFGTLTMPAGIVVADTLSLGNKTNTTGTPTLTGTVNQSGGTVTATTVYLGNNEGSTAANMIVNYNLTGGSLLATTITGNGATFGLSTVRNLTLDGGTIQNKAGGNLGIDGVDATAQGLLNLIVGSSGGTISAEATRTVTVGANAPITGSGLLTKSGQGTLLLNTTVLPNVSVTEGTLGGSGTLSGSVVVSPGATVAPGNSIGTLAVGSASITGTLAIEYQDAGGTSSDGLIDLLSVSGLLDITGASLALTDYSPTSTVNDTAYVLATYGTLNGTFSGGVSGLPSGYKIDYIYGGNSIAVVPIPEPAMIGLLGLTTLALRRRRA